MSFFTETVCILTSVVLLTNGEITLLMERNPPEDVQSRIYRNPEAGMRFLVNGTFGFTDRPARFIIDKADEQSVGATVPSDSLSGRRPADGAFLNVWNRESRNSVHIEVQLIKLINNGGILANGANCDIFQGPCDPVCYLSIDFQKPNEAYPGGATKFVQVRHVDNMNSPALDVVYPGSICASSYNEAAVRAYCEDLDAHTQADLINQWSCPIKQTPADSQSFSEWSTPAECIPVSQAGKIRLTYKYKVYYGREENCNRTSGG